MRSPRRNRADRLLHDGNLNFPFSLHIDAHVVGVTEEQQVNRGPGHFQVVTSQFAQRGR